MKDLLKSIEKSVRQAGEILLSAHIKNLLEEMGEISDDLRVRIIFEKDLDVLKGWLKQAVKSESIEEFIEKM